MNTPSNQSKTWKALQIAGTDALIAGGMGIVLIILYAWVTKEGSTFSQGTWPKPLVFPITWRGVAFGGVVGGILGSIIRPSWGPLVAACASIAFWGVLERYPNVSPIGFCFGLALTFGLVSFLNNMSEEPILTMEAMEEWKSVKEPPDSVTSPSGTSPEKSDHNEPEKPVS